MSKLSEQLREQPSVREPAYRPVMTAGAADRAHLEETLGGVANYNTQILSRLVEADRGNVEFRKALVSGIMSAEFAGIDAFGRKVCQWQEWPVPWTLIMAMARQTWDEVRHAHLAKDVLEAYGGVVGEYPDTLAGNAQQRPAQAAAADEDAGDPVISLSTVNVSLEGAALNTFQGVSRLGERIGDQLLEHCYDYNWADEVTHTAIGDYFVKRLCEDDPEREQRALRAHARFEFARAQLSGDQVDEIRQFFDEESERANAALAADSAAGYQ
jgi:uncharacterized ferritin-like protein (DUF455 family)